MVSRHGRPRPRSHAREGFDGREVWPRSLANARKLTPRANARRHTHTHTHTHSASLSLSWRCGIAPPSSSARARVRDHSPLEECMAALAFCSLDFCSFGGMVSSSYARSTARADCLWTASLTPGPPFLLVAAGGQLGRLFRVRIPSWAGFFLATRVENECKLLFCTEIGPERLPKIQPPPKAPPARAVAV